MIARTDIPPNPYTLKPITKPSFLAGRSDELNTIEYYLSLTAAGQSNHLALIGERGVGKTSLLNSAESLARAKHLLAVRIDMNEDKGRSPGRFWVNLYSSLCLEAAEAGCWGGINSPIYESLFIMIHARQRVPLSDAVLQFPFAIATHQGSIDDLLCPDALIFHDLKVTLEELRRKNLNGIVFLIDEANCLGANRPLIQMFRNIFQRIDGCSLILVGTEDIFPTLTEVFSPIPRQFHRISVKRFIHWADSQELIMRPFYNPPLDAHTNLMPETETNRYLHELCEGDPAELQLYCHHMYKIVQDGTGKRMMLQPQVFKDVLSAYRQTSPSNLESVLSAIEKLPDELLYKSKWFSWRYLTVEENSNRSLLTRELKAGGQLPESEKLEIREEIQASYNTLFESGIIETTDRLNLIGGPLTAGFWKSFVEVEKGERWIWRDQNYDSALNRTVINSLLAGTAAVFTSTFIEKSGVYQGLEALRAGEHPQEIKYYGVFDIMIVTMIGRDKNERQATDVTIKINHENVSEIAKLWYIGSDVDSASQIREFTSCRENVLEDYKLSVDLLEVRTWELPSNEEMHRLARIARVTVPYEEFGPNQYQIALQKYMEGDIEGTIRLFERMIFDRDEPHLRNNIAFCLMLEGCLDEARLHVVKALDEAYWNEKNQKNSYDPIMHNNLALITYLQGDSSRASVLLNEAISWIQQKNDKDYNPLGADAVLILNNKRNGVEPHANLPVDAAIILNLYLMNQLTNDELDEQLYHLYPEKHLHWLKLVKEESGETVQ